MDNVPIKFSQDQVNLIKKMVAPDATDDELKLFLYAAQRYNLDPLQRQIFCIHRNENKQVNGQWVTTKKMTIQTSIDGFRIIAERSGDYAGQDKPVLLYNDQGILEGAEVTVYRFRGETRYPAAVGVAYFQEYVQVNKENKPMGLWAKMPRTMVTKCAEALALRKAFPQHLSGLYTDDEMAQATDPVQQAAPAALSDNVNPAKMIEQQPVTQAAPAQEKKTAVKKTVKNTETVQDAQVVDPEPPATIESKWYARLDKAKTKADLEAMGRQYQAELDANPALKKVFREYYNGLKK